MTHITLYCSDLLTLLGGWPWATGGKGTMMGSSPLGDPHGTFSPWTKDKAADASEKPEGVPSTRKGGRKRGVLLTSSFSMRKKHAWEVETLASWGSGEPDVGCQATRTRLKDYKLLSGWEGKPSFWEPKPRFGWVLHEISGVCGEAQPWLGAVHVVLQQA